MATDQELKYIHKTIIKASSCLKKNRMLGIFSTFLALVLKTFMIDVTRKDNNIVSFSVYDSAGNLFYVYHREGFEKHIIPDKTLVSVFTPFHLYKDMIKRKYSVEFK